MSVLDIHTLRVDHVVPVGENPEGVAIDRARGVAYVATQGDGTISVVDTATWAVAHTVEVGPGPWGVALDEGTGTVYVTADGAVSVIDLVTRQVSTWAPIREPFAVAVDSSRRLVYVADESGAVAVVDAQTGNAREQVDIGISVHSLAVDATGQVWATSGLGDWTAVLSRDPPTDDHNRDQFIDWAEPATPDCGEDCVQQWPRSRGALVLHEYGHAWLNTHLDQTRQTEFMTHVGVTTWNDSAVPWAQRGVEWAAETIAWGLGDQNLIHGRPGPLGPLGDPPCQTLFDGFTILAAAEPLNSCE